MTRITNEHRSKILKDVLAHRFAKPTEKLVADYAKLAEDIYNDVYGVTTRQEMQKLPKGWLPSASTIKVKLGEKTYAELPFNGFIRHVNAPDCVPIKPDVMWRLCKADDVSRVLEVYEATHAFAERYEELQFRAKDLREAIDGATMLANSILEKGTTLAKLLSIWPEVKPFAEFLSAPKPKLPAMPISTLNGMLDLPVNKAA